MIIPNFGHPLTADHLAQIKALADDSVERVVDVPSQFAPDVPFAAQAHELADSVGFSSHDWQTLRLLINPPSYNFAALALFAEMEGRTGYLPSILRMRPVEGAKVRRFQVAEIIDLAGVRAEARKRR